MKRNAISKAALASLIASLPALVHAHPGHDAAGFTAGIQHALTQPDHIAVIVGLLAASVAFALPSTRRTLVSACQKAFGKRSK